MRCQRTDERWSEGVGTLAEWDGTHYWIALSSQKGFKARLRLELSKQAGWGSAVRQGQMLLNR